jgi:uncharacterized damage-inducible protein DinB
MRRRWTLAALLTSALVLNAPLGAQTANPISAGAKQSHQTIKGYIIRAAAKMPEEHYSFKPTPEVRSFGQLLGHIADSSLNICSAAAGEKPPSTAAAPAGQIEKTKTTKADLEKALAEALGHCDKVHAGMTDAAGTATVQFFGGPTAKLSVLEFNTHHAYEHYGNIVTYMRLKGLVPPSSERPAGK